MFTFSFDPFFAADRATIEWSSPEDLLARESSNPIDGNIPSLQKCPFNNKCDLKNLIVDSYQK